MRVFHGLADVPEGFGPSAVTVGKFDGVHSGHRAVIGRLCATARREGLAAVAVTFDRHPFAFHRPAVAPPALVGATQKLELLASTGVDATVILRYDARLAAQTPEVFAQDTLVAALRARVVLVGSDFRFGLDNSGTVTTLRRIGEREGFVVELIDDVLETGDRRVSSTWIRDLLSAGEVEHAAQLLGHTPQVRAEVVRGAQRGRALGFPTANLAPDVEGFVPADGVYAGWLTDAGVRRPAAVSVGDNPTFDGVPQRQVEAHVLDGEPDLYGHVVEVDFVARIRPMVAFESVEALVERMHLDVAAARELLAGG